MCIYIYTGMYLRVHKDTENVEIYTQQNIVSPSRDLAGARPRAASPLSQAPASHKEDA